MVGVVVMMTTSFVMRLYGLDEHYRVVGHYTFYFCSLLTDTRGLTPGERAVSCYDAFLLLILHLLCTMRD